MQRTKCTGLIKNLIAPCLLKELLKDVGDSYYSLIIDECTDISQEKLWAVCISYCSKTKSRIVTTFLAFAVIESAGTSDAIGNKILTMLQQYKSSVEKLIGLGVDGCSTMVGAHHSVSTFSKQLVPNIVVFKCVCHSLQLAAVLPSRVDFLIRESYNWFSHNSKRLYDYRELHMKLTNEVPNKLLQLCATRWMSRYECVKRILDQWKVMQDFFHQTALEEKCYNARQLDCTYQDPKNYAHLIFLQSILKDFSRLNKLFELRDADVVSLGDDFVLFYQSLLQRIVVPDKLQAVSVKDLLCNELRPLWLCIFERC